MSFNRSSSGLHAPHASKDNIKFAINRGPGDLRLDKHYTSYETYLKAGQHDFMDKWTQPDLKTNAKFDDFRVLKTLGSGGFGKVVLALKMTGHDKSKHFAMKLMEKQRLIKMKQIDHLVNEVRIMDAVNFPFLVHLIYFLKNNCYVFLVMPLANGGELFNLLTKMGKFNEHLSKFYASQVLLAFEYLHYNGVIYRDLKPENIMIDLSGYIRVTDFGFCKKIDDTRTYTLCGTPEYLAPELITSQGYNRSVDFWTLGILIYEMNAGFPPFSSSDPMKLYAKIVAGKFTYPKHFSKPLQHLLSNMIQVDRAKRFGILKNGTKDIKGHYWFRDLDWDSVLSQKAKPTYKPKVESPTDTSHFEEVEEEPLETCETDKFAEEFAHMTVKMKTISF